MKAIIKTMVGVAVAGMLVASCCNKTETSPCSDFQFSKIEAVAAFTLDSSAVCYEELADLKVACRVNMLLPTSIYDKNISALQDTLLAMAYGADKDLPMDSCLYDAAKDFGFIATPIALSDSAKTVLEKGDLNDYDGFKNVEGFVETLTAKVVCIGITYSEYMPRAAHGMSTVSYVNYDAESGNIVCLSDIVKPEATEELAAIIVDTAQKRTCALGPTSIEGLPSDRGFIITADGDIEFVYEPYEVASYAQGVIKVTLKPWDIDQCLSDYGKKLLY